MLIPNFNTKRPRYFFERPLCFFSTVSVVWLGEDFDVSSHVAPGSPRTSGPPHGPLAAAQQFLVPNEIWATRELNTDKKYHCHCPFLGRSANYSSFHPKLHIFLHHQQVEWVKYWLFDFSCYWNEIFDTFASVFFSDPRLSLVRTGTAWIFFPRCSLRPCGSWSRDFFTASGSESFVAFFFGLSLLKALDKTNVLALLVTFVSFGWDEFLEGNMFFGFVWFIGNRGRCWLSVGMYPLVQWVSQGSLVWPTESGYLATKTHDNGRWYPKWI